MVLALLLSLVPSFCRLLISSAVDAPLPSLRSDASNKTLSLSNESMSHVLEYISEWSSILVDGAFGSSFW